MRPGPRLVWADGSTVVFIVERLEAGALRLPPGRADAHHGLALRGEPLGHHLPDAFLGAALDCVMQWGVGSHRIISGR